MIFDRISNIANYRGMSKGLDEVIEYITRTELYALPEGKTELNDGSFINKANFKTKALENQCFEIHKRFTDIFIILEGVEKVLYADYSNTETITEYDEDKDIATLKAEPIASFTLKPGYFLLFSPLEPHLPGLCEEQPENACKCVIKVLDIS